MAVAFRSMPRYASRLTTAPLFRYRARPALALEGLREIDAEHRVYESVKPGPSGSVSLMLTPMEMLDRLAALIPSPRRHRNRYVEVMGPNAPLRGGGDGNDGAGRRAAPRHSGCAAACTRSRYGRSASPQSARLVWAILIARIYEIFPLVPCVAAK
jgi:hypothetical protein